MALSGCASYQTKIQDTQSLIRAGKANEAAQKVAEKAAKEGDDQIVYLFEYATALQVGGNYADSTKAFLKAEDLTSVKDYHSLSRLTGSILLNEGMVQYKGEDYEKVLINAMLAINFLVEKNYDAALVETRKLNDKLYKYKFEAKRNYEQNPFAFYLSAMIWENDRNWDSAYIDYKKTYDLNPNIPYLKADLLRAAANAQRPEEVEKWQKHFPGVKPNGSKQVGELVLIYQQGWAPKKLPHPDFPRVPKLYPVSSETVLAKLVVQGAEELSQPIHSIQEVAIKTLDDAYAELVSKRAAGLVAKAVVSDQIRQKNQLLGDLAWIGMNLADRADLRQWSTLPATMQIAKVYLPPGTYKAKAIGLNSAKHPTGEESAEAEVVIKPRKKAFIQWRSIR